jgi:hypothetical protein
LTYIGAEGVEEVPTPSLFREEDESSVRYFDNKEAYVMTPNRYLALAQQFRDKIDAEADPDDASDGPIYVDDMTKFLQFGKPWDDFEIILIPEQ